MNIKIAARPHVAALVRLCEEAIRLNERPAWPNRTITRIPCPVLPHTVRFNYVRWRM